MKLAMLGSACIAGAGLGNVLSVYLSLKFPHWPLNRHLSIVFAFILLMFVGFGLLYSAI